MIFSLFVFVVLFRKRFLDFLLVVIDEFWISVFRWIVFCAVYMEDFTLLLFPIF